MFGLRYFSSGAVALPDTDPTCDQNIMVPQDLEKSDSAYHILSPRSNSQVKRKRLPHLSKVLILASFFALALFLQPSIVKYATLGYDAIVQNGWAHHSSENCSDDADLSRPISIAAPPWAGDPVGAKLLDRNGWEVSCDSQSANPKDSCGNAIDSKGDRTWWQSGPGSRHWIVIDLKKQQKVHSFAMSPGRDRMKYGGMVRKHQVQVAGEAGKWVTVAIGSWREDDDGMKYATFEPLEARFVNLTIIDTTMDKDYVTIGDIGIYGVDKIFPSPPNGGKWGITIDLPLVPVTAFINPISQKLVTLASWKPNRFSQNNLKQTYSATWDPATGLVENKLLSSSDHDMFCPGTSFDENGSVIVTGGDTPLAFSIYDSLTETWSTPKDNQTGQPKTLTVGRGYQGQTFLADGRTFMIGGAWSGGNFDKNGEIYDPKTETWTQLPNIKAQYIKMDKVIACQDRPNWDNNCVTTDWQQHHAWLFAWKQNSIFHAGPSRDMNWFFVDENGGSRQWAGFRDDSWDAVCGVTSMYDAENGIILTAGGSPNYHYWVNAGRSRGPDAEHRNESTREAFEITLGEVGDGVQARRVQSMTYQRIFANGVILPTGETLVVGGQIQGEPFYDETWQPIPEIYSPETGTWREVARHSIPRAYHSWAMLLPDASVVVGGTGLERDETDHYDAQIYYPSYLFKSDGEKLADRPKIIDIDNKEAYKVDSRITVTTDVDVDSSSLIRYSAATHALNNDLRRIKLKLEPESKSTSMTEKKYSMKIPEDPGVALPGYWMLFVLRDGVPSVAKTVQILAA